MANAFEERWIKQGEAGELVRRGNLGLDNAKDLVNEGGWCAQVSRSIDSRVNAFDPSISKSGICVAEDGDMNWSEVKEGDTKLSKRYETAVSGNLTYNRCLDQKKGRLVDSSIHMTNIHHIRRAKHFIYIESQYFMGSSFMWSDDKNAKCGNLIAAEVRNSLVLEFCS